MQASARTLARRKASRRIRRAWTKRYLAPGRKCRGCGCTVAQHAAPRTGARCVNGSCSCWMLDTKAGAPIGARPRARREPLRVPEQVEAMRHVADLERSIARWRRGLAASYAYRARREVREADMLASLGNVEHERAFVATLIDDLHRTRKILARST